jgi:hypothetical protein
MNSQFQAFCDTRLPVPGLAAWAVRHSDRSIKSHCLTNWLAPARVEQSLTRLVLAAESLQRQGIEPVRLSWVFEHARIHLALRPEGACLALFVENRPDLPTGMVEGVLEDFLRLA